MRPELDSSSSNTPGSNNLCKKVRALIEDVGLMGIWRDLFPRRRDYSLYSSLHRLYTRIDYFITFVKEKDRVQTCDMVTIDVSDHAPLYLTVNLNLLPKTTTWELNSSMLKHKDFKEQIKKEIRDFLEINENGQVSLSILRHFKSRDKGRNYCNNFL